MGWTYCAIRIVNVWRGFVLTTTLSIMLLRVPNLTRSFTTKTVKGFIGAVGNTPLVRTLPNVELCMIEMSSDFRIR